MSDYLSFLASKTPEYQDAGFTVARDDLSPHLFEFQRDIVTWALKLGRAAIFADTGLGKTLMQLEWAHKVHQHTGQDVLILAPLAVAKQTAQAGAQFGLPLCYCRHQSELEPGVMITNYEMLKDFDSAHFGGIALDESSRIKSHDSKTRDEVLSAFARTPYRSAWTATPAPNDHMELGNHSEFLGVMTRAEMLSMYFTHDGGETSKWRLKGHAERDFWRWVATWAVVVRKPSDLGYGDEGYNLPGLNLHEHIVDASTPDGMLFYEAQGLSEQRKASRASLDERVARTAQVVNAEPDEPWVVWCELNDESAALVKAIPGAVEVKGSDSIEQKERAMLGFADGSVRVLVTKSSIAGFGMNWQHCARTAFCGISNSYEMFYQSIRRFHRFGQTREVAAHLIYSEAEAAVMRNLKRKESGAQIMQENMLHYIGEVQANGLKGLRKPRGLYNPQIEMTLPGWIRSEAA